MLLMCHLSSARVVLKVEQWADCPHQYKHSGVLGKPQFQKRHVLEQKGHNFSGSSQALRAVILMGEMVICILESWA